jgi:hypothetical protein
MKSHLYSRDRISKPKGRVLTGEDRPLTARNIRRLAAKLKPKPKPKER